MTPEEYRGLPGLNFSSAKHLLTSPFHYWWLKDREFEETLAMRLGSAVDEYVLSGIVRPHAIMPPEIAALTGKGSRTARQAWVAQQEADGCTVYKREDWERQSSMQRALAQSVEFQRLLELCPQRQLPVFASYKGVNLKCLLDLAGHDANGNRCMGDLKCILDASPRGFGKRAYANHLDLQIVMYMTALAISEGLESPPLPFWAAVESSGVPAVSVFGVPSEAIESGQRKLEKCIELYKSCSESGEWPGYNPAGGFAVPVWPAWAAREDNE